MMMMKTWAIVGLFVVAAFRMHAEEFIPNAISPVNCRCVTPRECPDTELPDDLAAHAKYWKQLGPCPRHKMLCCEPNTSANVKHFEDKPPEDKPPEDKPPEDKQPEDKQPTRHIGFELGLRICLPFFCPL